MNHTQKHVASGLVVVGVDGSENSERAFDFALSIAQRRQSRLKVIAAYTEPAYEYTLEGVHDIAQKHARSVLDTLVANAEGTDVAISSAVIEGNAAGVLIAESEKASVVVAGKRSHRRFAGRLLGGVSASLAAHSHCPTVIVPDKRKPAELPEEELAKLFGGPKWSEISLFTSESVKDATNFNDCVVVGIDLDARPVEVALRGAEYAKERGLSLTLVTAEPFGSGMWGPASVVIPDMRKRAAYRLAVVAEQVAEQTAAPVEWRFFDASPADVLSYASETASLIVVGTRGHGGFTGLLLGSVSQAVLNRTIAPVLVIPTKTDK